VTKFELVDELINGGVRPETIVRLDVPATHQHVRYLDLIARPGEQSLFPDAVIESAGQPFAYVLRRDRLGDVEKEEPSLAQLIRILACRSDAKYLCVVAPGNMVVYPIVLSRKVPQTLKHQHTKVAPTWLDLLTGTMAETAAIPRKRAKSDEQWLEALLFNLLSLAARGIQQSAPSLTVEQTLALVGRALFFRFLVDRKIVAPTHHKQISPAAGSIADVFATSDGVIATSRWLDTTFNGDLLSLGPEGAQGLVTQCGNGIEDVCWHLTNIQHNSLGGQMELDWSGIHFRHVPVDVLSQVYEDFAHEFVPELAKQTSVHFTPRAIAEILVDGVFSAVHSAPTHAAKVLDPSVGGGVFLVLALRRLVAEHWAYHGQRPDRARIRAILNHQLVGFDINRDALNVCALSLYLAALELDPEPSPISELKFDKLIGSVLVPVDIQALDKLTDSELGSLSKGLRQAYAGAFDIVVGNPPWTGWKGETAHALERCLAELIDPQAESANKIRARYGSPDVAFLLAARHWAKPAGAIGFALHARLLFQAASMPLRRVVFETIRVTGVMNFSALRQDAWLWPSNDAQFILLTGRNIRPENGDSFYFLSPRRERALEQKRQFRIDPSAAVPVSLRAACNMPYTFKALYKGSALGLELINRLCAQPLATVAQALEANGLVFASGYQLGTLENQTQPTGEMRGMPEASLAMHFEVPEDAPCFKWERVQWPRAAEIYKGPLILFRESPKRDLDVRGALYAPSDTVYREHYLGVSFSSKPELKYLRDALYVLSYSDLVLYYQLLTSPKFGVERDSALQSDFENVPLPNLESLRAHSEQLAFVADAIRRGDRPWQDLNSLIAELYELSPADEQLIEDTLATELPFAETRKNAEAPVSEAQLVEFVSTFNKIVAPFTSDRAQVLPPMPAARGLGWVFFAIADATKPLQASTTLTGFDVLSDVAENYWVSVMQVNCASGYRLHGRLNQTRYWTRTEARLAAVEWIRRAGASL